MGWGGKNQELFWGWCEVLSGYPCGQKWQLDRRKRVWRSGERSGLHWKSLGAAPKVVGMDEITEREGVEMRRVSSEER